MRRCSFPLITLLVICAVNAAWADNLGALAFVVFIWPIGIVSFIILGIVCVISIRRLKNGNRGQHSLRFPLAAIIISSVFAVMVPAITLGLAGAYQANAPVEIMVISILPVEIIAAADMALNLAAIRRIKKTK